MNIRKILDESVGEWLPEGYLFCPVCGDYEHHPFIYCSQCGIPLIREKDMIWRDFIKRTAFYGAGPINTVWSFLCKYLPDLKGEKNTRPDGSIHYWDMNPEGKSIYAEANRIYESGGNKSKVWPPAKYCPVCSKIMVKDKHGYYPIYHLSCRKRWEDICREDYENEKQRVAEQLAGKPISAENDSDVGAGDS